MNVDKWGPGGWIFLHTITFNYPLDPDNNDKQRYRDFFNMIGSLLPCKYCRDSFKIYVKYIPIEQFLDSREALTYWLYRIHNLINEKIFKPCNTTFKDVVINYEKIRAGCSKLNRDNNKNKQYNTCKIKLNNIEDNDINIFVNRAENLYKPLIDKLSNDLMNASDNPNKKSDRYKNRYNRRYKIIYII